MRVIRFQAIPGAVEKGLPMPADLESDIYLISQQLSDNVSFCRFLDSTGLISSVLSDDERIAFVDAIFRKLGSRFPADRIEKWSIRLPEFEKPGNVFTLLPKYWHCTLTP